MTKFLIIVTNTFIISYIAFSCAGSPKVIDHSSNMSEKNNIEDSSLSLSSENKIEDTSMNLSIENNSADSSLSLSSEKNIEDTSTVFLSEDDEKNDRCDFRPFDNRHRDSCVIIGSMSSKTNLDDVFKNINPDVTCLYVSSFAFPEPSESIVKKFYKELSKFHNLKYLNINQPICEFSFLRGLKNLKCLEISVNFDCKIDKNFGFEKEDVASVKGLDLTWRQPIDYIGFISKFSNLEWLNLSVPNYKCISPQCKKKSVDLLDLKGGYLKNVQLDRLNFKNESLTDWLFFIGRDEYKGNKNKNVENIVFTWNELWQKLWENIDYIVIEKLIIGSKNKKITISDPDVFFTLRDSIRIKDTSSGMGGIRSSYHLIITLHYHNNQRMEISFKQSYRTVTGISRFNSGDLGIEPDYVDKIKTVVEKLFEEFFE